MQLIACLQLWRLNHRVLLRKFLLMKFFTFLLLIACVSTHGNGFSQQVSLSQKNAELEKIFKEITRQTGYTFIYTENLLQKAKKVTIAVHNAALEAALDACFRDQPLSYSILNKMVIIKEKMQVPDRPIATPVLLIEITGTVTDNDNRPLQGASVSLKGSGTGTTTDANGRFSLSIPGNTGILVISFVGFNTQELNIAGRSNFEIALQPENKQADEVVVIAYGSVKKSDLTGAVSSVSADKITQVKGVSNIAGALQGQAPGVQVIQHWGSLVKAYLLK